MSTKGKKEKTILIVGDWIIDEYWFLVRHHSETSSHTGYVHYRLANQPNEIVSDLCAAGHVARVLYNLREESESVFRLFGVGNWSNADTGLIRHLLHARETGVDCAANKATFCAQTRFCDSPPDIGLATLDPDSPTVRVVRQYHQEDRGLEQINRVDLEPERHFSDVKVQDSQWKKLGLPKNEDVDTIVIHDLGKGIVGKNTVKALKKHYKDASWYVRSKTPEPDWLELISDKLELLVVGPEVAALRNPWESWISNGRATGQALKYIDDVDGKNKNVVLISHQHEVIARLAGVEGESASCVTASSSVKPTLLTELGWPSAFFACLLFQLRKRNTAEPSCLNEELFSWAISVADFYAGVPAPKSFAKKTQGVRSEPKVNLRPWESETNEWKQARENKGIIRDDHENRLEVWRGSTDLSDYIACIEEKKELIRRIGKRLRAFEHTGTRTGSLSVLLQADPGAGKTSLVKALAKATGFDLSSHDVTQMLHRDDLLHLFDTVATKQANQTKPIMVFVDEINAKLDASEVYGAFLSPLEEGIYLRQGRVFSLKPCVWVFAGTNVLGHETDATDKLSDLISRVTMKERIDYKHLKQMYGQTRQDELKNQAKLEQVYLGAVMMRKYFSDIQEVSEEVLNVFHELDPEATPTRDIRRLAASLRNVQYGKVTRANCTSWHEEVTDLEWSGEEDSVKLVY